MTESPAAYVTIEGDGTYTGFVRGKGFRANVRLPDALEFIRDETGRSSGSVPCWDKAADDWDSELDLDPAA